MAQTNDLCGRLVRGAVNATADFEGKNARIIEEELGQLIGMAPAAIQRYKTGVLPGSAEIIAKLADVGASRAYLNRTWGERFLRAAGYPYGDAEALLDRLWGRPPDKPAVPPRAYHNLPAPTYHQFVMRAASYAAVLDGLGQRTAVVVVVSMGGMGKTSLAREVAGRRLAVPEADAALADEGPRFDAAIWISDKDHPGATTLAVVLDEIAHTLDYPGITQFDPPRKRREVEQLLRRRRVLLVVDNFETIADDALLHWLLRLPEPSKALITTREYRREFQQGAWLVELGGMSELESRQFLAGRSRQLNMKQPPGEAAHQLIAATGGNPKAMDMLIGFVKRSGRTVAQVLDGLHATSGDLLRDLFDASWNELDPEARHTLLTLTLFPMSVADTVLATVSGLDEALFLQVIQQLVDLALIETEQSNSDDAAAQAPARRALHPLTRQFAETKLAEHAELLEAARARWLAWAVTYVESHGGYRPDEVEALQQALNQDEPTLWAALNWAFDCGQYGEVLKLATGLEFYYYVQLFWSKKLLLHERYIEAARRLGDVEAEISALAMHIQLLSRQGHPRTAEEYLPRLRRLAQAGPLRGWVFFTVQHTHGLYHLASGELSAAEQAWRQIIDEGAGMELPAHTRIGTRHWLALCRYRQGEFTDARTLYQSSLEQARALERTRWTARLQIALALLDMDEEQWPAARERVREGEALTAANDWEQRAHLQQALARLYARDGDLPGARGALRQAIEFFERMGLVNETLAARAELDGLSEQERAVG